MPSDPNPELLGEYMPQPMIAVSKPAVREVPKCWNDIACNFHGCRDKGCALIRNTNEYLRRYEPS